MEKLNFDALEEEASNDKLKTIIDRVKKLLALSKSDNPHEAELALGQAQSLMMRYSIEQGQLDPDGKLMETDVQSGLRIAEWEKRLTGVVGEINGCVVWYTGARGKGEQKILRLFGKKSDLIAARYMLGFIKDEFESLCNRVSGDRAWKQSYREGLVDGVTKTLLKARHEVLVAIEKEKAKPNTEMGIVRVGDNRADLVRAEMARTDPRPVRQHKAPTPRATDETARMIGKSHGERIDPNRSAGKLDAPTAQMEKGEE